MHKNKLIIHKREGIPPIPDYIIPVGFCNKNASITHLITGEMTSKFELFLKNKMNNLYSTKSMQTEWIHMLYEY